MLAKQKEQSQHLIKPNRQGEYIEKLKVFPTNKIQLIKFIFVYLTLIQTFLNFCSLLFLTKILIEMTN